MNTRCSSQRNWPLCHAMGDETLDTVLEEWTAALQKLAIDVRRTAAAIRAPLENQRYCNDDDCADWQPKGEGQAAVRHDADSARVHGNDCVVHGSVAVERPTEAPRSRRRNVVAQPRSIHRHCPDSR